jgi:serine/threonine protein phosphatase 1
VRTFAIGDIHGHAVKLAALLDRLRPLAEPGDSLVLLGDYIDRGPDSRGVIERIIREELQWPGAVAPLMGNHEMVLLAALFGGRLRTWEDWLQVFEGEPTVRSYGARAVPEGFLACLPTSHHRFLEGLRLWHEDENGLYVHAGIPRGRRPEQCDRRDLLWQVRTDYEWEKPVVFGHQDRGGREPVSLPGAVGLDTGCGSGGPLTAVMLPEREFFQA